MAFKINNIYHTFLTEFINFRKDKNYYDDVLINVTWKEFIKSKDLGILCITSNLCSSLDEYEIIDEKKWLLSKLKYNF
jgi:hypothetical protein